MTFCLSGVAHTFLNAKSLEKAAYALKIKIEVQGAKGVINRITKKILRKRSLLLFAQDVVAKEPYERISR